MSRHVPSLAVTSTKFEIAEVAENDRGVRGETRETYAGKLSHYFLAKFVDSVIVKLIKVNVLSVSLRAGGLRVPSYAGRNQIALFTAAGRREAVGR
jgi:hypothetical protein